MEKNYLKSQGIAPLFVFFFLLLFIFQIQGSTAVELDVGPDIYCLGVYINGFFFEEICVQSGDVIIFE